MTELSFRALEPKDARTAHVLGTHPEVARTFGGSPGDGEEGWQKRIAESAPDRSLLLGAFEGERLVGVAMMDGFATVRRRHAANLSIAVAHDRQRRGVGDALLGKVVEAADRWWGYFRLELGVHADHGAAVSLYEKHGFVVETKRPKDMLRDGVLVDGLGMARVRPGFVTPPFCSPVPVVPPRAAKADVVVRPRRRADSEVLARLHETDSVIDGTFQLPFQTVSAWEKRVDSAPPGSHVFVAEIDGKVVGAAGLFPFGTSPRLRHAAGYGTAVHPDAQGRGVGEALLLTVLDQADRWLGLERVVLEVYVDNDRARKLYEKHGFQHEGTLRAVAFRRGAYADAFAMARLRSR